MTTVKTNDLNNNQIGLMMPELMRIMCGGPNIGEYTANGPQDEDMAQLATQYVNNVVLKQDNDGHWVVTHSTYRPKGVPDELN